ETLQPPAVFPTQPSFFTTRTVEAGYFSSSRAGRSGRRCRSPPQFGQRPASTPLRQLPQYVHSNEQIQASAWSGGSPVPQHSQLGRNSSIVGPPPFSPANVLEHPE